MDFAKRILGYVEMIGMGIAIAWAWVPSHAQVLVVLMTFDYAGGVMVARSRRAISSSQAFQGLLKKSLVLLIVAAFYLIEHRGLLKFYEPVALAFIFREVISLTEKAALLGVPLPRAVLRALQVMQDQDEGRQNETESEAR